MTRVQFTNLDARLAYLALQYHLARPGSELDPVTKQPGAHRLSEVARELEPQLDHAAAAIDLSDEQRRRLVSALAGAMNELKASAILSAGGQTMVPAFREALRRLFPAAAEDPDESTRLAGHMLVLRRRLEQIEPSREGGEPNEGGRSWWRIWKRKGT